MPKQAKKRSRIEHWMLGIIRDGGVQRFDDLHIDKIDSAWKSKSVWIDGGLEAFSLALEIRNLHRLSFDVGLGFSLEADDQLRGVDFRTREEFLQRLDWSPPSLYLFDRGQEPDRQTAAAGGAVQDIDPTILGLRGHARCYYLEFKTQEDNEFRRSVFFVG